MSVWCGFAVAWWFLLWSSCVRCVSCVLCSLCCSVCVLCVLVTGLPGAVSGVWRLMVCQLPVVAVVPVAYSGASHPAYDDCPAYVTGATRRYAAPLLFPATNKKGFLHTKHPDSSHQPATIPQHNQHTHRKTATPPTTQPQERPPRRRSTHQK